MESFSVASLDRSSRLSYLFASSSFIHPTRQKKQPSLPQKAQNREQHTRARLLSLKLLGRGVFLLASRSSSSPQPPFQHSFSFGVAMRPTTVLFRSTIRTIGFQNPCQISCSQATAATQHRQERTGQGERKSSTRSYWCCCSCCYCSYCCSYCCCCFDQRC